MLNIYRVAHTYRKDILLKLYPYGELNQSKMMNYGYTEAEYITNTAKNLSIISPESWRNENM